MINGFETKQDEYEFNYGLRLIYKTISELKLQSDIIISPVKKEVYKPSNDKKFDWEYERIISEKKELGEYIEYNNILYSM